MTDHDHTRGVPSTAALAGHPIHPILIPFPIAFLTGALATDVVFWLGGGAFWAGFSFWLILAGLVMGAVAAAAGFIDFITIPRARRHRVGWLHFLGADLALALAFVNLVVRWGDTGAGVLPWGMLLSLATAGLLGLVGWYGGELAYRHMIGVTGHGGSGSHESGHHHGE